MLNSETNETYAKVRLVLTANITKTGTKFRKVPNVVIIFISKFDIFKDGYALYHVDKIVRESSRKIEDGLDEIYVNSAVKDGSKVSELMELFVNLKAYNKDEFPVISETKKIYKETEEGVQTMCEITEKLYKKGKKLGFAEGEASGIAKGKSKGILFTLKNMMETLKLAPEKALEVCKIPSNECSFYFEKLKEVKQYLKSKLTIRADPVVVGYFFIHITKQLPRWELFCVPFEVQIIQK